MKQFTIKYLLDECRSSTFQAHCPKALDVASEILSGKENFKITSSESLRSVHYFRTVFHRRLKSMEESNFILLGLKETINRFELLPDSTLLRGVVIAGSSNRADLFLDDSDKIVGCVAG